MQTYHLSEHLSMIDVQPPISGWNEFVGVYVLGREQMALIDAGPYCSAGNLINGLDELGIERENVSYIFLTHIHIDHAGAAGELLQHLPNARVVVHPRGAPHLANPDKLWEGSLKTLGELAKKQGRPQNVAPERIIAAEEGTIIPLGDEFELEVIHTPGHAAHHMSFFDRRSGKLFAGEAGGAYTAKVNLLRPATPPPLLLEHYLESIDKLLRRDATGIYYAHYGPGKDARTKLQRHKEQAKLWREVICDALEHGAEYDGIFSKLMAEDASLNGLKELPKDQYQREHYFIINAIGGFVGYIEKQKT